MTHDKKEALERLVAAFDGDATSALLVLAQEYNIAVAWLDRLWFEEYFDDELNGYGFSDEEWAKIAPCLGRYDEFVCETTDLNYDFARRVLERAGVTLPGIDTDRL